MDAYQKAVTEYDHAHERAVLEAINQAIIDASMLTDTNTVIVRTGEIAAALITALACTLAMSPSATRTPVAINKVVEDIGKSLRKQVANAEADPALPAFVRAAFRDSEGV